MSPELGLALFVTLLWGPTALWLGYRVLRQHRDRLPEPSTSLSESMRGSQIAPDELEALVGSDQFWICETCRSLNRHEANRCYGCRTAKGSAGLQAPAELPVSRGVPVMAEGIARSSGEVAWTSVALAAPTVSRGIPVMAEGIARSSGEVAGATVALAAPTKGPPAQEIPVRVPEPVLSAAPPEAPADMPVCPFLGFKDDPWTHYDYPDPANRCHATSERGTRSVASQRRFVTSLPDLDRPLEWDRPGLGARRMAGTRRSQPIGVEHQEFRCLTAAHEQCARYPAGDASGPTIAAAALGPQ